MTDDDLYADAVRARQRGNLAEAGRLCAQILAANPDHNATCQLLGILRFQEGRKQEALELFGRALSRQPNAPESLLNYGITLKDLGRDAEALDSFQKALDAKPDFAPALHHRGQLLKEMGRHEDALRDFERGIEMAPFDAEGWNNRGAALQMLHRFEEAIASYEKALAYDPGHPSALTNMGAALLLADRIEEGLAAYTRHARQMAKAGGAVKSPALPHKARHDQEQRAYLRALGIGDAFHLEGGEKCAGPAVNPANRDAVCAQWQTREPQIAVMDDFLTPEALEGLRRFCLGSTVWQRSYGEGYVGALLEHGFACPLIGQIARELRQVFPAILGGHPLLYLWAFKYDSRLSGVKLHADSAAVNVNFWITPDDANREPAGGGLIVWDRAAPAEWEFERYNANEKAMRDFLEQSGAQKVTIPYRANRAVVFDSDLFHQTDRIDFRDGYQNRRINVTLLYGWRGGKI